MLCYTLKKHKEVFQDEAENTVAPSGARFDRHGPVRPCGIRVLFSVAWALYRSQCAGIRLLLLSLADPALGYRASLLCRFAPRLENCPQYW